MSNKFPLIVAYKTLNLLIERRAILYEGRKAFWVWNLPERVVVLFDTSMVDLTKLNEDFAHKLSTRLNGRMVVRTNSRGLFLQVDPEIPPAPLELSERALKLSDQPSPFHMPVGMTGRGDLWISLQDGDSFFVVGMRGMGKTGELHGMIQALLHGGQTKVFAWDGKENAEYLRYVGHPNFVLFPTNGLQAGLQMIQDEARARLRKLAVSGHANTITFNAQAEAKDQMMPMALFVDEVAEVEDQSLLLKHVKLNRAAGLHPIFATNDPSKAAVIAKSNLATRISFKVISSVDSSMGLGQTGANQLPNMRGRGLIVHNGKLVEFQSFTVEYPKPSEEGMKWLVEQIESVGVERETMVRGATSEISDQADNEHIREMIEQGRSDAAIVREIWNVSGGSRYYKLVEQVRGIRSESSSSSTSTATSSPYLGLEGAI